MDEGAVVREQQQARRIVIQTPHRLHIAPAELLGQQGNEYRLIVAIAYRQQIVYSKFIGTHVEYDAVDAYTVEPD